MRLTVMIAIAGLSACAAFPTIDGTLDATAKVADYPTLLPLEPLLAAATASGAQISPASEAAFSSKIAALRAKAARLRGPVIDAQTRSRMQRGVAVSAAIR
ncbi:MAG: hypothetical protein P8J02_12885 [Yoonia sp.]|nr:hypothetical protein [Yoonia sp.]